MKPRAEALRGLVVSAALLGVLPGGALVLPGCATGGSGSPVRNQQYAKLSNQRLMEYEFPQVWKAIETVMRDYRIMERDPEEVTPQEMRKLSRRTLETDWLQAQSRDKYQEYASNGSPRKVYLQIRLKYEIEASRKMGGTQVVVRTFEEVQRLKPDGTPDDYETTDTPDPTRAHEILERIQGALLSAAP